MWLKEGYRYQRHMGSERLQQELAEQGIKAGVCRIRRIRKKLGLKCKQKKKFKATTDSNHKLPVADNLLDQKFEATAPNRVWVSDITYIPTEEETVMIMPLWRASGERSKASFCIIVVTEAGKKRLRTSQNT